MVLLHAREYLFITAFIYVCAHLFTCARARKKILPPLHLFTCARARKKIYYPTAFIYVCARVFVYETIHIPELGNVLHTSFPFI